MDTNWKISTSKKSQEKTIMVSDFSLKTIGRLKLTPEQSQLNPNIPVEARKYLKSEKMKKISEQQII